MNTAVDTITIQTDDFNHGNEYQQLRSDSPAIGAIVTFTGLVRDFNTTPDVTGLYLECYPAMVHTTLRAIIEQAKQRWPVHQVRIIHRIGQLQASDQIVFVGVNSPHREASFNACHFIMDYLKTEAPFWKKENTTKGDKWVEARTSDEQAKQRWQDK